MVIYIGADHRGFKIKDYLKNVIRGMGYEVADMGNAAYDENDDYPDFAAKVAEKVMKDENSRGVLICGAGVGVDVVANKFPGIRSALVMNPDQAYDSRNDNNANVLCLGANYLEPEDAKKIVVIWLQTPWDGAERHLRRIRKIAAIEEKVINANDANEGEYH